MAREDSYTAPATYRELVRQNSAADTIAFEPVQNLPAAIGAGVASALLAALLWAAITVATGYNYVWAAIGVGFLVGYAVRIAGKGSEPVFSLVGCLLSLLGCALGKVLAACAFVANAESVPLMDIVGQLSPGLAWEILGLTASPFDLILFGVAAYQGYKLSVN